LINSYFIIIKEMKINYIYFIICFYPFILKGKKEKKMFINGKISNCKEKKIRNVKKKYIYKTLTKK